MRQAKAAEASDFSCAHLQSGKVQAQAIWDAISLAAADSTFRYKTGGEAIGGAQIHAVTTTNALRFVFDLVDDSQTRLINLLQAAGVTADFYVRHHEREGNLRSRSLLDLQRAGDGQRTSLRDVFNLLPFKAKGYNQTRPDERMASDQACRLAFYLSPASCASLASPAPHASHASDNFQSLC